ncbi:oxygenase MpaB family protein [Nocardia rhizosphaerihabitans]|uniref:oxygenase MpaB family protein n=1 Tax=Nocardia rhizosphaerihabitans TaxID=1691570 RepID=UPI00366E2096
MSQPAATSHPQNPVDNDPARRRRYLTGAGAILGGPANVVMQLSLLPVGRGVVESTVESGSYATNPGKRGRTTLTYLAVAMLGTDEDRAAFKEAVGTSHRQVRNRPGGPVKYNAFDPRLQLWVAACIYRGTLDSLQFLFGELDETFADELYRDSARFGTTLQVPAEMWPADRAAFARYWDSMLGELSLDDEVRGYLLEHIVDLGPQPWPIRIAGRRINRFFVTGYLPQQFRDAIGLAWSPRRQRVFELVMRGIGRVLAVLPAEWRAQPFPRLLADMRARRAKGKSLV